LTLVDQLLVKQEKETMEIVTGHETPNKYKVLNTLGQQVFYLKEEFECCAGQCGGGHRPFNMKVLDNNNQAVMNFYRPFNCSGCLCPCCQQEMEVSAPPGNVIGFIRENWTFCSPKFTIYAADQTTAILVIKGPSCTCSCGDVEFQVLDATGEEVLGNITKKWSGYVNEAFTDADNFSISFPMDLDVNAKGTLLGMLMLIDFLYFEQSGQSKRRRHRHH